MVYIKKKEVPIFGMRVEFLMISSSKYHTWPIMISSHIHIFEFICLLLAPNLCHKNTFSLDLSIKSQDRTPDVLAKW